VVDIVLGGSQGDGDRSAELVCSGTERFFAAWALAAADLRFRFPFFLGGARFAFILQESGTKKFGHRARTNVRFLNMDGHLAATARLWN
jgi:hypothetical protein